MASRLSISRSAIRVSGDEPSEGTSVDIKFDGHRVWSTSLPSQSRAGWRVLNWPDALRPYLKGTTTIEVSLSANSEVIGLREVSFTRDQNRTAVLDSHGRWLAMNKWDRLGPVFEGDETGVQERLLDNAVRLVAVLEDLGYPVYIVGGTLLGAMRNGALMAHDDDIDLAFLCDEKNPLDISLVSMRMQRQLEEAGFTPIRHSLAHLQVTFFREDGSTDHYIDIFTGFIEDDLYSQPFALRGPEVTSSDLLPVQRMEISGRKLPAPANPDAWLTYAYGENWRVPDPTFTFMTPSSTRRRFNNWFGVFNKKRVFWEKRYEKQVARKLLLRRDPAVVRFLSLVPPGSNVVDLGCGDGAITQQIANRGHRVVGVDYSYEALRVARESGTDDAEYRYLNINDRRAMLEFAVELIETREVWYFFSNNTVEGISRADRRNLYLFLREVLRGRGFAFINANTNLPATYSPSDPTSWHYPEDWRKKEAKRFGMKARTVMTGNRRDEHGARTTAASVIRKNKKRIDFRSTREY